MKRVTTLAVLLGLLLVPSITLAQTNSDRAHIAAVETKLRSTALAPGQPQEIPLTQRMADLKVPGVSIAFIENGKVKWVRSYGVADAEKGIAVTPNTLFQAASMSKAVAAAGALKLVEQGRLDLDSDVNTRLKSWKVPRSAYTAQEKVTLRRLLGHTAGLTVSGFPGYDAGKPVPTVVQILEGTAPANTPPVRSFETPGQAFAYSGGGFTVAQLLMIEAGGKPYPDLLENLVLRPAQMRRSTFVQPLPQSQLIDAAAGHNTAGEVVSGRRNTYPEYAAASLWTTPGDYGRFMIGLQNAYAGHRSFLRRASAQSMMTPGPGGYGLGEFIRERGGRPAFMHGGSNRGFQCLSFAFLDGSRQGVVIMTNGDSGGRLANEILNVAAASYGWGDDGAPGAGSSRRAPLVPTSK